MPLSGSKSGISGATSEALVLAGCVLLLFVVSVFTPLDSAVRLMLAPLGPKLFSPTLPLWTFTITTGFLTLGLLGLMSGRTYGRYAVRAEFWRENGVFLILLVLIGPAIGGPLGLAPSSAGFYGAAGWWIGKRRHPGWATLSLVSGLILGLTLGLSEMATGSQRLSQILWSGLVILGLAHALYYYVLRLPLRNDLDSSARLPGLPAMCLLLVVAAVARLPHESNWARQHWVAHVDDQSPVHLRLR